MVSHQCYISFIKIFYYPEEDNKDGGKYVSAEKQKTVLLVEDDALIGRMLKQTIESYGYKVNHVYKAAKAIEAVDETPGIDLILMDINLGEGMDGTEAAEIILAMRDIPLIFISSHTEREIVEKTEGITSYGYIVKTAGETVLITSIKMAFRLFDIKMKEKEKNDLLRENEKYLAEAQRVAKLGHWKFDIASNSVTWSDELYNIFGVDKESFEGQYESFIERVHPDDRYSVLCENRRLRETGENFEFEYRILSGNGRVKYIREVGYSTKDVNGRITGLFGTAQDITDIKLINEALLESELKWNSLVENIPDYISVHDSARKFLYLNRHSEGYSGENVIGMDVIECIQPELRELWDFHFNECLEKQQARLFQYPARGGNKDYRFFDACFIPVKSNGGDASVIIVGRDITERKLMEEKLKKLVDEKNILLKEVHHRIKNNITSIENLLTFQLESPAVADASMAINDAISRVKTTRLLYDNLLHSGDYRQIQVKKPMNELIDIIISLYDFDCKIIFTRDIDDFQLDSGKYFPLSIIATELVSNIMKHAFKKRGEGAVHISLKKDSMRVCLKVADNGTGFPDCFNPDKSESLGIILVKMLSEQLDGSCVFENHNGVTCSIEFTG
jgi:PAS domain S-box-containing protein